MDKLTMTLLAKDDEDIIEDNIAFHRMMGVDEFIVLDNNSRDSTSDILGRLSFAFPITIVTQTDDGCSLDDWLTYMARLAVAKNPKGWIINGDVCDFWHTKTGNLKDFLRTIKSEISVITAGRKTAVLEYEGSDPLTAYSSPRTTVLFERDCVRPSGADLNSKVIHRFSGSIKIIQGGHSITGFSGNVYNAGDDLTILRYPYRSLDRHTESVSNIGPADEWRATANPNLESVERGDYVEPAKVRSSSSVIHGLAVSDICINTSVRAALNSPDLGIHVTPEIDYLLDKTEHKLEVLSVELLRNLAKLPQADRRTRPLFKNYKYGLNGPMAQIDYLRHLRRLNPRSSEILRDFSSLRDAYSLFPSNRFFHNFLASVLRKEQAYYANKLDTDCDGKIVILHVTCSARIHKARASRASFGQDNRFHHIFVVGQERAISEPETPLRFTYKDNLLILPVPDSYESLHRKVFFAFTILDMLCRPKLVVKLDDDLRLLNRTVFLNNLSEQAHCSGRAVGSSSHCDQWHGWHIGKCHNSEMERKGYQYPLPNRYAAGGYGYSLNREALSACSYTYLTMLSFFDMPVIGLEDVYVGHALGAFGFEVTDVSSPEAVLAFPGLAAID